MLADSRLIGYANLTVRPPPDYYGQLVISYFDGFDASAAMKLDSDALRGLLSGKLFAGYAAEKTPLSEDLSWDLKRSLLVGGYVDFVSGPWQTRLGYTQIRFKNELPLNQLTGYDVIGLAPEMSAVGKWTHYASFGVVYDKGPLQVQSMFSQIRHESAAYEDTRAGYFIAAYRLGQVTPYLGYSRVKSKATTLTTPLPPPVAAQIALLAAQTHSDQHTVTLGARWDFQPNMDLKAQVDFIRGTPRSVLPFRDNVSGWDGRMNVFSLTLDFVF
jgi:predicted porin